MGAEKQRHLMIFWHAFSIWSEACIRSCAEFVLSAASSVCSNGVFAETSPFAPTTLQTPRWPAAVQPLDPISLPALESAISEMAVGTAVASAGAAPIAMAAAGEAAGAEPAIVVAAPTLVPVSSRWSTGISMSSTEDPPREQVIMGHVVRGLLVACSAADIAPAVVRIAVAASSTTSRAARTRATMGDASAPCTPPHERWCWRLSLPRGVESESEPSSREGKRRVTRVDAACGRRDGSDSVVHDWTPERVARAWRGGCRSMADSANATWLSV
mmetsp:Transcript_11488/g.29421  ORF Transcript_11488/g.29421 Transcript_11488/m.29421 type:complete len:272 (-) Transcript_11488:798-1613(-)